jgi:hypothetical protein
MTRGKNDIPEMTPQVSEPLEMAEDGFVDYVGHGVMNAIETGLRSRQPAQLEGLD